MRGIDRMVEFKLYKGDCLAVMKEMPDESVDSIVSDAPYGINFMGKKWDYDIPSVEIWKESFRVLKSGGHILIACGTRTQHRMAVNIEDAGFEIRDLIAWIYGQGFPKSLNICKAINKKEGVKFKQEKAGGVGFMNENDDGYNTTKHQLKQVGENSERAKEWEGWGTALKPAMELWTLARKPLSEKSIVDNVLKHGTGGLNIDGCRVETEDPIKTSVGQGFGGSFEGGKKERVEIENNKGRFPANVMHDGSDEVVEGFPKTKSAKGKCQYVGTKNNLWIEKGGIAREGHKVEWEGYGDQGSASRFFYCPKASKREKNEGLEHFDMKRKSEIVSQNFENAKTGSGNERNVMHHNNHPTVKPVKLMEYLCRLITKPNGICMDIFMGSGSTGLACQNEGFNFIGIELDPEYYEIAKARLEHNKKSTLNDFEED